MSCSKHIIEHMDDVNYSKRKRLCILSLPTSVLLMIAKELDVRDLVSFGSTCRQLRALMFYPGL